MKHKCRIGAILLCLILSTIFLAVPVSAAGNKVQENIHGMNDLTFEIFKTIRTICIPLAIISFASCGWKFLGSIFFGNYVSMAGTDMMKAQKQLVLTILAVMLVVLFPRIYGVAIKLFQEGFANGDGTIFKPWTPGGS